MMNKTLRHFIFISALISMALSGVVHAVSPEHQQAKDFQECTFCLHHAGTQLHTAPEQIIIPQPIEISSDVVVLNSSTVYVRSIRRFNGRAPPQIA